MLDQLAVELLSPSCDLSVLDVTPMARLRPDAHTAVRHGGGRLPPDCLHWALPGLPDVWNAMLVGAIAECG